MILKHHPDFWVFSYGIAISKLYDAVDMFFFFFFFWFVVLVIDIDAR